MGVIMPIYTVGIIIFFLYTAMKVKCLIVSVCKNTLYFAIPPPLPSLKVKVGTVLNFFVF